MNLRNWKNWGTNIGIRLGFRNQFAHAFAEQDYYVKETEEKEVSLLPTFLEWNPFRNIGNPRKWSIGGKSLFGGGGGGGGGGGVDVQKAIDDAQKKSREDAKKVEAANKVARDKMTAEINALKAKQVERQGRATASASALKIVGGARRDTTAKAKKKASRRVDAAKTARDLVAVAGPGAGGGGGSAYGGNPVI